jgi:hypothetical protein
MQSEILVEITSEGKLELPAEVLSQFHPGDQYKVSIIEDTIVLKKLPPTSASLEQFFEEMDELQPDPTQPTLEEISETVKEVRHELWSNS